MVQINLFCACDWEGSILPFSHFLEGMTRAIRCMLQLRKILLTLLATRRYVVFLIMLLGFWHKRFQKHTACYFDFSVDFSL